MSAVGHALGPAAPVTVVVPNFNGAGFIGETLEALACQTRPPRRVLVIDNGSTDDSVRVVRGFGVDVELLGENTGFGGAANAGLAVVGTPLMAVLNSDARPRPDWLEVLATGPTDDDIWAWGSVQVASSDGTIESAGDLVSRCGVTVKWRRGGRLDDLPHEPYEILAPPGAAPLLRVDVVRRLGGWWTPYFLYYEDIDLALRARLAGHRAVMIPRSVVEHDLARSSRADVARRYIARNSTWCAVRSNPGAGPAQHAALLRRELRDARERGYVGPWLRGKAAALPGLPVRLWERRAIMRSATRRDWRPDDGGPPGVKAAH